MTTPPGETAFTTHELYALIQPSPGSAVSVGARAAFGFPGPESDLAMYSAGVSTLIIRNRLSLTPEPSRADPETAVVAELMREASVWVMLHIVTDEGRQTLRAGLGAHGHVVFTPDGQGAHSVDLLAAGENLTGDLSGILAALLHPLSHRTEALLLASVRDDDGEHPANLRIDQGALHLAAGPVDQEGRLPETRLDDIDVAAQRMAEHLLPANAL